MRKSLLVLAVLLSSATTHAASTRGLSVPDGQQPVRPFRQAEVTVLPAPDAEKAATQLVVEAPKPIEQPPVEHMKSVSDAPKAAREIPPRITAADMELKEEKSIKVGQAERRTHAKPRKKRLTTEARIRYELGRYGITW